MTIPYNEKGKAIRLAYEFAGGFFSVPQAPNSISSASHSMAIKCCETKWQEGDVPS